MSYISKDEYLFLATEFDYDTMSGRIKGLRYKRQLTLQQASEQSGIPLTTLRYWELGKSEPKAFGLFCLSKFYKVSIDYIVFGEKTPYDV